MDHFFTEVYESIIYQWIVLNKDAYIQKGIQFYVDKDDPNKLLFQCQGLKGEICFWPNHHIIEETIIDEKKDITFYLHFRIINLSSAQKFIQDFIDQLLTHREIKKIAMSCSCGITSSVFVEKIQKLSELSHLPYLFEVVPIYEIENVYKDYDMLILAPQTAYLEPKIKAICQNACYVTSLDAAIFATNHYQKALAMIQEKFELIEENGS